LRAISLKRRGNGGRRPSGRGKEMRRRSADKKSQRKAKERGRERERASRSLYRA
jgi:hypothetical protein